MSMPLQVIVTDAEELSVLAVCRALGRAGYLVTAVSGKPGAASHWSRTVRRSVVGPPPIDDPDGFVELLRTLVQGGEYAALMHGGEGSLLAISERRSTLEPHVRLGLPSHDAVLRGVDRVGLLELAGQVGLPPPDSAVCADRDEAYQAVARVGFPVAVKPARSLLPINGSLEHRSLTVVEDEEELATALDDYSPPFVLQRFEPVVSVLSCSGLYAGGRLLGANTSRSRRTYPPEAGTFSLVETIAPPNGVVDRVEALLGKMGWQGLFQADILETADGRLGLVDFNPRPWRSLALDVHAGVNLPALWCDWLLGKDPAPARGRPGHRFRWEAGEARHALWQLRRGRVLAAAAVLRPRRRTTHSVFSLADPGPFASRIVNRLRRSPGRR
jgi:predicted ATP-grasp superfamily ATP-dependent carboligase